MMKINKVIFITLDSLRASRLGVADYYLPLTPTLDRLARSGIYCAQTVAPAACTQMAHPTIWSSTLPLAHGGYDTGITKRPCSVVELFQQQGFHTVGFSDCFFLSAFFGYDRGFAEIYPLYDPRRSWQALYSNYFSHYLRQWRSGRMSQSAFVAAALPLLQQELDHLQTLAQRQQTLLAQRLITPDPILARTPFTKLQHFCHSTAQQLATGGAAYFLDHLDELLPPTLFQNAGLAAPPPAPTFVTEAWRKLCNRLQHTPLYPLTIANWHHHGNQERDTSLLINGAYVVENALQWVRRNRAEKLFLWVALGDIHELRPGPTALPNPLHRPHLWLERVHRGQPHPGSFLYDLAVAYEDALVERLLQGLTRQWGQLDDVLVVICADHGRQWWMDGDRAQRAQRATLDFYEEDVRVPLIFWHPALGTQRIEQLCGLIDLAPTLVDLLGWPKEPSFGGEPVYSTAVQARPHLLLEDAGRGPCNLAANALRITVRTPRYKYIWQAANAEQATGGERNELYDLHQDPQERHNMVPVASNGSPEQRIAQQLKAVAQARNRTIKAQTP